MEYPNDSKSSETVLETSDLVSELFGRPMRAAPTERLTLVQRELRLSQVYEYPSPTIAEHFIEHHQKIMDITEAQNLPITFLGFGPVPQRPMVFRASNCICVLVNTLDDPLTKRHNGRLLVPRRVRKRFRRMKGAGVDFRATFVAHDLPEEALDGAAELTIDHVEPAYHPGVESRLRGLERGVLLFQRGTIQVIKAIAVAGAALSFGALTVPAALAAALPMAAAAPLLLVDPILLGVEIVDEWRNSEGLPIGAWYYCGHWFWPLKGQSG